MKGPARRFDLLDLRRRIERLSLEVTTFEAMRSEDGGVCFNVYVLDEARSARPKLEAVVRRAGLRLLGIGRAELHNGKGRRPRWETFATFGFQP